MRVSKTRLLKLSTPTGGAYEGPTNLRSEMVYDDWNRVESPRRTFFCFALLAAVVSPSTARGRCQAGTESPKDSVDLELQSITRARLNRCSPYFKLLDPPPKLPNGTHFWMRFTRATLRLVGVIA